MEVGGEGGTVRHCSVVTCLLAGREGEICGWGMGSTGRMDQGTRLDFLSFDKTSVYSKGNYISTQL